ncbi:cupin domain-containing protein [Phytohabitans kaempferiae]|uniref:Cupin domain-containing protein n=1 Tax=Phytohabitans kaempferiae TaxID=1620943 RepID=A0ABV6MC42_9ACTN
MLIRTARRDRLNDGNRPDGCPASSAGLFVIRADGTARFDRHYHDMAEFWLVAAGTGTIAVGDQHHHVIAGDIVYTPAGVEHDIIDVADELHIFWLSAPIPAGGNGSHLHRTPDLAVKHPVAVATRDA